MERNEMKILETLFDSLDNGMKVAFIEGEEGVGKTDFIQKFCSKVSEESICTYSSIKELRDDFLYQLTNDFINNIKKKFQPGRLSMIESLGKNVNENEKFLFFLSLISSLTKTVIILDDIEYGSASLFNIIMYILKNHQDKKILLVLTYNPLRENPSFKEFLLRIEEIPGKIIKKFRLENFNLNDVINLIADMNYQLPKYVIEKIYESSKGNSKKIVQVLEYLKMSGLIDENNYWVGSFEEIPKIELPSIRSYFYSVYNKLNDDEKRVLTSCSIIGQTFSIEELMALENLSQNDLYAILDKFIQIHILEEYENNFKFKEIEYREIIYNEEISNIRRRFLHRKLAEYYESKNEDPYKIGMNYFLAGEAEKAIKYLEIAGMKFYDKCRYKEALDIFLKIYDIGKKENYDLIIGDCYFRLGNFKNARNYYEKALEKNNIDAKLRLAELEYTLGNINEADNLLNDIKNANLNDEQIFYLNYLKGSNLARKFLLKESLDYYNEALKIAQKLNRINYLALIYKQIGISYFYNGDFEKAENLFKKSLEYYDQISDYEGMARIYNNLALIEAGRDFGKTLVYYELSLSYANLSGNIYLLIILQYNMAQINFWNSKIDEAERGIKIAKNLSELINEVDVRHSILSFLSDVEKIKGNFTNSIEYIDRAISLSSRIGSDFYTFSYMLKKYELYSIIGKNVSNEEIENVIESIKKINPEVYEPYAYAALGKINIYNGNFKDASKYFVNVYDKAIKLISFSDYVDMIGNIPYIFALEKDLENFKKYLNELISLSKRLNGDILHIKVYTPSIDKNEFNKQEKFFQENNLKFLLLKMYICYYIFNGDENIKNKIIELSNELNIRKDFITNLLK
ncbi:MAG: ATP-binding protein [Thermoplasmata archaeon]